MNIAVHKVRSIMQLFVLNLGAAPDNDAVRGHVKIRYSDGASYEGQWERDQPCGHGVLMESNGERYEGCMADNCRHGVGQLTSADGGTVTTGLWREDNLLWSWPATAERIVHGNSVFEGRLTVRECEGTVVTIDFTERANTANNMATRASRPVFKGCMTEPSGQTSVGQIQGGVKEGCGVLRCPDGSTYAGHFRGGMRHGLGLLTRPDGRLQTGTWDSDRYVADSQPLHRGDDTGTDWPTCGICDHRPVALAYPCAHTICGRRDKRTRAATTVEGKDGAAECRHSCPFCRHTLAAGDSVPLLIPAGVKQRQQCKPLWKRVAKGLAKRC